MRREQTREEFDRFVASSADDLLRTAYLVVWDLPTAQDLVQECLFQVARRWPRIRSMAHPGAYARRVLVNLALDDTKRRGRHRSELDQRGGPEGQEPRDESAERAFGTVETTSGLIGALGSLAPRRATRYLLFATSPIFRRSRSPRSSAAHWGTSRARVSRALERLRQMLPRVPVGEIDLDGGPRVEQNGIKRDEEGSQQR